MGRSKLLLPAGPRTLLAAAVMPLLEAGLERVVVVLGWEAERLRREAGLPDDARVALVVNPAWAEGMASSLRCGVAACAEAEAVVLALGDQPGADPETLRRLVAAFRAGAPLAAPVHGERAGHPVLFARALFPELMALAGDVGAREVVRRHWLRAARVPAPPLHDLDTEADYRAFLDGRPAPADSGLLPQV